MSNPKQWYVRTHDLAPYTRADGQAVSDEFDAIQASFEVIPAMRDDGKGFAVSPVIPDGTEDNHPASLGQLRNGEQSVLQMKNAVEEKARQVAQHAQTTATNTQTAVEAKRQAVSSAQQSATSAQTALDQAQQASQSASNAAISANNAEQSATTASSKAQSAIAFANQAGNAEQLARKWATNPENQAVQSGQFSALHYSIKAKKQADLATAAKTRAVQAETNAQ